MTGRPFAWEKSYPPGLAWDTPIAVSTLPQLLDRAVAQHAGRTYIEFRGQEISFQEFGARVDAAAAGLQRLGVGPEQAVALFLPNTPYHPISFFAVLRAGARVVHLSPLDPPRALARKLADSGARAMITTDLAAMLPQAAALLAEGLLDHLVVGEDAAFGAGPPTARLPEDARATTFAALSAGPASAAWPPAEPGDLAVLQYTGGTTGMPRAAMLTHANLTAAAAIYAAWFDGIGLKAREGDRVIGILPLFHIYALVAVMLRCLAEGVAILLRLRFDAAQVLDDIEHRGVTSLPGVPTMFIALAAQPDLERRNLASLRSASCGGATLPVEVARRFEGLTGRRVGGGWGMTETCSSGTHLSPGAAMSPGLIGVPLPGIEIIVVDLADPRRRLAQGEVGELAIRGPNITAGYWNRPEETAAAIVDGFLLTGDVGTMDAAGSFSIVDRKKDMIISGGFNVYPRMIEDAVYEHAAVEECTAVGIPDAYRGQSAKVFIKLRDGAEPFTLEELRGFLADKLGRHELPAAVEFRDSLPRTAVGKLSRKELADEERIHAPEQMKAASA